MAKGPFDKKIRLDQPPQQKPGAVLVQDSERMNPSRDPQGCHSDYRPRVSGVVQCQRRGTGSRQLSQMQLQQAPEAASPEGEATNFGDIWAAPSLPECRVSGCRAHGWFYLDFKGRVCQKEPRAQYPSPEEMPAQSREPPWMRMGGRGGAQAKSYCGVVPLSHGEDVATSVGLKGRSQRGLFSSLLCLPC